MVITQFHMQIRIKDMILVEVMLVEDMILVKAA
jgi:hypothetical protein